MQAHLVEEFETTLPSPAIGEITATVDRRNLALEKLNAGIDLIFEAIELAPEHSFNTQLRRISWYGEECSNRDRESLRRDLDRRSWHHLIEKTKLGAVMNNKQLEELRKDVDISAPVLTEELAMTTFMDFYATKENVFRKGLVDVFKSLSGNYKSHSAFKVKNRIILSDCFSGGGWKSFSGRRDIFTDLWRYLALLDGIDTTVIPYSEQPADAMTKLWLSTENELTFDQFRVRVFNNGNVHIWLDLRPDLLVQVNTLIAEHYASTIPDDR